jgi:hypothetical protein
MLLGSDQTAMKVVDEPDESMVIGAACWAAIIGHPEARP